MKEKIVSPCISICKTDPVTGYCYGCARTNEEKKSWKLIETTDEWKKENLLVIMNRMAGWQLETFKESLILTDILASSFSTEIYGKTISFFISSGILLYKTAISKLCNSFLFKSSATLNIDPKDKTFPISGKDSK